MTSAPWSRLIIKQKGEYISVRALHCSWAAKLFELFHNALVLKILGSSVAISLIAGVIFQDNYLRHLSARRLGSTKKSNILEEMESTYTPTWVVKPSCKKPLGTLADMTVLWLDAISTQIRCSKLGEKGFHNWKRCFKKWCWVKYRWALAWLWNII